MDDINQLVSYSQIDNDDKNDNHKDDDNLKKKERLSRSQKKLLKYEKLKLKQHIKKKKMAITSKEKFKQLSEVQVQRYYQIQRERDERIKQVSQNVQNCIEILIDMEYDVLMEPREIRSLAQQIARISGLNKELKSPIYLHLTKYEGLQQQELEKQGSKHWVNLQNHDCTLDEFIKSSQIKKEFIYLSPDAESVLDEVNPQKYLYIIGGFVDRNVQKFMSYNKSSVLQIQSARLPINDYIKGKKRPLNIDTVACLLSEFHTYNDWKLAYEKATSRNLGLISMIYQEDKFINQNKIQM